MSDELPAAIVTPKINSHLFFEEFKPLWLGLKCLGMFPYRMSTNGDVEFKLRSREMLYSVGVYCLLVMPLAQILYITFPRYLLMRNIEQLILSFTMTVLTIPQTMVPYTHWMRLQTFTSVFKRWNEFQNRYKDVTGSCLQLDHRWRKFILLPCSVFYFIFVFFLHLSMPSIEHLHWVGICYLYILTVFFIHTVIFLGSAFVLASMGRDIRRHMLKCIEDDECRNIEKLSQLWLQVSKMCNHVGILFHKTYCSMLLIVFTLAALTTYIVLQEMSRLDMSLLLFKTVACQFLNETWLFVFCEYGEYLTHQVGFKTSLKVAEKQLAWKTRESATKVSDMLAIMAQFPPSVTLSGYVIVNRALYVKTKATLFTYLLVVWQFSSEASPQHRLTNLTTFAGH